MEQDLETILSNSNVQFSWTLRYPVGRMGPCSNKQNEDKMWEQIKKDREECKRKKDLGIATHTDIPNEITILFSFKENTPLSDIKEIVRLCNKNNIKYQLCNFPNSLDYFIVKILKDGLDEEIVQLKSEHDNKLEKIYDLVGELNILGVNIDVEYKLPKFILPKDFYFDKISYNTIEECNLIAKLEKLFMIIFYKLVYLKNIIQNGMHMVNFKYIIIYLNVIFIKLIL